MRFIFPVILLLLLTTSLAGEAWTLHSDISVSLTQSAFSNTWAGTELSNITWVANSTTTAEKQLKPWLKNTNTLKLAFGQTHLQKTDALGEKYWEKPDKTTDKIDLESVLRFTTQGWVDPFVAGRMESQFLDLSQAETLILNPLLFTETAGVIRTFVDTEQDKLTGRLGAALRENYRRIVNADATTTVDGGLELVSEYRHIFEVPTDSNFRSKLLVYQALFNSKSDQMNEDWKSPDVVWENVFTTKLFGMVSANLALELRYDKEQVHDLQWKQILSLGLSYSLF